MSAERHGGDAIAEVLVARGVRFLYTLCGGHVSPILSAARRAGVRVVDTRHEATAVFAADATARLDGVPGVAVVTAGPGVSNTVTAVKNAQLAHSPVVLFGGATATLLRGRGALQDVPQIEMLRPHVKWAAAVRRRRDLVRTVARAFDVAAGGVPGPVFVECPVDLLYPESTVRAWYGDKGASPGAGIGARLRRWYVRRHVDRLFAAAGSRGAPPPAVERLPAAGTAAVRAIADLVARAERPVLLVGSPAVARPSEAGAVAEAVGRIGVPAYLSGMARGLLGRSHPLLLRHRRRETLREADVVVLAGVPCDFRLDYGRQIPRSATVVGIHPERRLTRLNRKPDVAVVADPGSVLRSVADLAAGDAAGRAAWLERVRRRDLEREADIAHQAVTPVEGGVHPIALLRAIDATLPDDAVLVADGGDFVATASYVLSPRGPLGWLDPGPFGTLGVGAGFALAAALSRPGAEVWLLWGDGSAGYSLQEIDTFVRHALPVIGVVGNDAGWTQIARDQVRILGDDVATVLRPTDYERVAEGWGGAGARIDGPEDVAAALERARAASRRGLPVVINARIARTAFREGSISI